MGTVGLINPFHLGPWIGRGRFWNAYQNQGIVSLVSFKPDKSKGCLARWGQGRSVHVPQVWFKGLTQLGQEVYQMPYYRFLSRKYKQSWSDHTALEKVYCEIFWEVPPPCDDTIRRVAREQGLREEVLDALLVIVDCASRVSREDARLEFNESNLATDSEGNIILRDILFFASDLKGSTNDIRHG